MTMATALSAGQMKDLTSAVIQAIPTDLPADVAQRWIGRKGDLADKIKMVLLDQLTCVPDINWALVYEKLGMRAEYDEFAETNPAGHPGLWNVPVLKGVTPNKVVAAMKKLAVQFYLYANDLDKAVPTNDRDPANGSYVVGFRSNVEADEEFKNLSANQLKAQNHRGITLLERLLLELGYFLATGKHLDEKNVTLCTGSHDSGDDVPCVRWYPEHRLVYVYWYYPDYSSGRLRSRSAVS